MTVAVSAVTASGVYSNQVTVSGTLPTTIVVTDLSDDGADPDPNGNGDPTEAGENDPTSITLTGSIGDFVWNDVNGDGVQDIGETGIPGVTVFLDLNTDGTLDGGEPSDITGANGAYDITNLPTGTYSVQVDSSTLPPGVALSTSALPLSVSLAAGEDYNSGDFGYSPVPVAAFSAAPQFGCGPLTVQFTDSSLNATAWEWDFGDGFTSTDQNPEHVYETPGIYTVVLTAQNGADSDVHQKVNYIQVIGPNVGFTATPTTGNSIPLLVSFTDQTVFGAPLIAWLWNFGDGNTSTVQNPSHNYTQPGVYTVSLTVTDLDGCSRTLTQTDLVVIAVPPVFDAAFSPGTILSGEVSTLTFTVDNTVNTAAADNLAFTVNLASGVVIATPANASSTLTGGTLTATAGSGILTLSGASVSAGTTATVQVNVTGTAPGTYVTVTGDLTSDFGTSGPASDTLVIKETPSLVVDTLQDTEDDFDSKTSLREAMTYALTLGGTPEITFSNTTASGAVDFYEGTPKTITLAGSALPQINAPLSILGPGANVLAISGNNASRIFLINANNVSLSDLTLTNGHAVGSSSGHGGAIRQDSGDTTITRCQISNSVADTSGGAIVISSGPMIISDSTLSGNTANGVSGGGSLFNGVSGTLTIVNSTLSGNNAPNGGAIINAGSLTLIQTTITGNRASDAAGGLGTPSGSIALFNSIIAGNFKGVGTTPSDIEGNPIDAASNNLIGDAATAGGISDGTDGNIVGNAGTGTLDIATVLDTALADNGGLTLTHALIPGSPAINAGSDALALDADDNPLTNDQRGAGFPRIVVSVDMGAFELQNTPPTLVGTPPNAGIPDQSGIEDGADITVDLSLYFADAEQASYSLDFSVQTNTNAGLVTPSISGKDLTLTLIADQSGTADITIRATDNGTQFTESTFTLTVTAVNDTPVVSNAVADFTVNEDAADSTFNLTDIFSDIEDADSDLTYTVESNSNPSLVTPSIDLGTDILTLDYLANQNGTVTITVRAEDSGSLFIEDTFMVTVTAVNDTPVVSNAVADFTVDEDAADSTINLTDIFSDIEDTDSDLTYTVVSNSNPSLVTPSIDLGTDILTLDYLANQNGTVTITVRAEDSGSLFIEDTFTVTITAVNDTPTVDNAVADFTVDEDAADSVFDLTNIFSDIEDADSDLTYIVISNSNPSLVTSSIDLGTDELTLDYQLNQFGTAEITVRATDSGTLFVEETFIVTVTAVNDIPVVSNAVADFTVYEDAADSTFDLTNIFSDIEDADSDLSYTVVSNSNPSLVATSIDAGTDMLTVDYLADQSGTVTITVRATDSGPGPLFVEDTFTVTVNKLVDLTVTAVEDKDPVLAGNGLPGNLIHQIKVMNNGPSDATNLVIDFTQTLPAGVTLDSATPNSGSESSGTWTIPALAEGQMAILTLTLSVPATVVGGTDTIITVGGVTSVTEPLTATGDDTATVETSVSSPASTGIDLETGLIGNFANSLLEQFVKVTNNNPDAVPAFRILVSGLPNGVTLFNAHGTTATDVPFIVWNQELAPGGEEEVLMQYARNTGLANFTPVYTIEFLTSAEATALLAPPALGDALTVVRFVQLADESMLVEWASVPGMTYYIQYTSDMTTYTTVLPGITAGANRTQWIDRGPPQTESHPSDVTGLRAYRVMEAN
ncbi:MAG: PKD domain-containing protein [Kiritimatiellae bacterium]|nr:PKD domain-containing protein [Kiritimatiellia bacterium]